MGELTINAGKQRRVAVYIRVSTTEQKIDGYSMEAQEKRLMEYIEANKIYGFHTQKDWVFRDTHTGSDLNRESLIEMRKMVREKRFDAVLVWKIDRLSRSLKHLLVLFEEMENNSVSFISVQENIDFKGPIGRLIFQIFGAIAQFERELIKGRTVMGRIASAEMGNYTGSYIPYGYRAVPNSSGKGRKLQIIPEEAEWVRKIYEWYVYDDLGFGEVANKLNQLKVPIGQNMKAKRATFKWTDEIIRKLIRNPVYRGRYYANKKDEMGAMLEVDKWTSVPTPAIISDYLFLQAQEIKNKRHAANAKGVTYILAGKLRDVTLDKSKSFVGCKRSKGGLSYRRKQFTDSDGVYYSVFEVPARQIEEYVIEKISEALKDPEVFIKNYLSKQFADKTRIEKLQGHLDRLEENKVNQEIALERVQEAFENGSYSEAQLVDKSAKWNKEIAKTDEAIQQIEDELRILGKIDVEVEKLREASKQVKYRLENLTRKDQQVLVKLFVDRVEMFRRKEGKHWKIFADVHFRFNPEKFGGPSEEGRTGKGHEEKQNEGSDVKKLFNGATDGNRTRDLILTMDALYHLSYCGLF